MAKRQALFYIFLVMITSQPSLAVELTYIPVSATDTAPTRIYCIKELIEAVQQGKTVNMTITVPDRSYKGKNSQNKDKLIHVTSGIPEGNEGIICLYSMGWAIGPRGRRITKEKCILKPNSGPGVHAAYHFMSFGILHGTIISFDYPSDSRRLFNGGQEMDVQYLYNIYKQVIQRNPKAHVLLAGDCKGGTTILNLITHPDYYDKMSRVCGIYMESPPLSIGTIATTIAHNYLWWLPGSSWLVKKSFSLFLPNYNTSPHVHTVLQARAEHIPKDLPIFIGCIAYDDIADYTTIQKMVTILRSVGNQHVHLFTTPTYIQDPITNYTRKVWHAGLVKVPEYQKAVNRFLKKYGFEHDTLLL